MSSLREKIKKIGVGHYVCVGITLAFLALGAFFFLNSIARIIEAFRDLGTSIAYLVCSIFVEDPPVRVTVLELPSLQFVKSKFHPLDFSATWGDFKLAWRGYWNRFADLEVFGGYLSLVLTLLFNAFQILFIVTVYRFPLKKLTKWYLSRKNNKYDYETKPTRVFKWISDYTYRPIRRFVLFFLDFVKGHKYYAKTWLIQWLLYFNVLTIGLELFAFLLYYMEVWELSDVFTQVYKLSLDLTTAVRFIPLFAWIIGTLGILEYWARSLGYRTLEYRERRNCGFINSLGVLTIVFGEMGKGKTKLITDMALSEETRQRHDAFEIIVESDFKFPNMNWATLEQDLKQRVQEHEVFSIPTVRKWLWKKYRAWCADRTSANIWGYDFERYGLTYNDNLKVSDIWEVIDDYACAYFIYSVSCSLMISNYSIRTDNLISDVGNFPLWNMSFFKRDARFMESYSRHSHIIDFDMLRMGKTVVENNPNRYAFGFGVYVFTEFDKERKNDKELRDANVKASDENANQRNDLTNVMLKMSRHACVVANRVFLRIFVDMQRPESLGADARELGGLLYPAESEEFETLLPWFAPSHIICGVFSWFFGWFVKVYYQFRYFRSDKTLPVYVLKNIAATGERVRKRRENLYGSSIVRLQQQSGRMDGAVDETVYFIQKKKTFSNRYATDCHAGIFDAYFEKNAIGIMDMPEYLTIRASEDELLYQNSFFQLELRGYRQAA